MLRFTTRGAPFERGVQQGEACRDLILPWYRARQDAAIQARDGEVERWVNRIERVYPDGIAESRGIAQGLGLEPATYFAVQARFLGCVPQCTTCGLRDDRGNPLLAKTDDLFADEVGKNVMETAIPDRGYRHVHFHFGGTIWTVAGMNEHGLAIAMTGIPGPTLDQDGMPSLVSLHTILPACATVKEALTHLERLKINRYGFSLLIGDASGAMVLVECTGRGMKVLSENEGEPLLHTNHILHPEFGRENPAQSEPVNTNGFRRYINAAVQSKTMPRSMEGLHALLADRQVSGAICQMGEDGLHTDFAVVFNPVEKQFTFWPGPPAKTRSEIISLANFL